MADVKSFEINGTELMIKDEYARQQLDNIANEDLIIGEDGKLYIKQGDGTEKGTGVEIPTGTAEVPSNVVLYEEIEDEAQETLIPIKSPNNTTYYLAVDDSGALTVQNTSGETVWEGGGASIEGVYFISNRLTNIVSDNTAKNVLEGDSYVATLTPTSGYEISDITVKMGNTDITSTAYADGNINITNVTGNIVITATATKIPTKYNVVNNLTNATNSNSATQVNENTSYVATITSDNGYAISNVVVTMGGVDITESVYSNGNINISNVTGDISITVNTTESKTGQEIPYTWHAYKTVYYRSDDTSEYQSTAKAWVYSEEFDVDTDIKILVTKINDETSLPYALYVGCMKDVDVNGSANNHIDYSQKCNKESEQLYTVKAGYGVCVWGFNNTESANISITYA